MNKILEGMEESVKSVYFKTRKETIDFLEAKGFEYYIPRKVEALGSWANDKKYYYVEVNKNDKIVYCSVVAIEKEMIFADHVFYDCDRVNKFYKKEAGEQNYKEGLELGELLY